MLIYRKLRSKSKKFWISIAIIFLILNFLIPILAINLSDYYHDSNADLKNSKNEIYLTSLEPKVQAFFKDDYTSILESDDNLVGMINITDLDYNEGPGIFNYTYEYPELNDDLTSGALNISFMTTKLINTTKPAKFDQLDEEIGDSFYMEVQLNESVSVQYNKTVDLEGYLIYLPKIARANITQLYVENNTISPPKLVNISYYDLDPAPSDSVILNFNFLNYFNGIKSVNFTFHIIYTCVFIIDDWHMEQEIGTDYIIEEDENVIQPKYEYRFNILTEIFPDPGVNPLGETEHPKNILVNLSIHPMNMESLFGHTLQVDGEMVSKNFLNTDNSIYLPDWERVNGTSIFITFRTTFTIEFVEPLDFTWAIDRLVEDQDTRERIYFPKITSGPSHIILKYVNIIEETIAFDQMILSSSLFERPIAYSEINISTLTEERKKSLIFHEWTTKRVGIKITLPYIIRGEICPFMIKYETSNDLKMVVTDNIGMPLVNVEIVLYYYGEKFGTYISKENTQPLGPIITDENGEAIVKNVPNGNYTAKIYPKDSDELLVEAEVSAFLELNYIRTSIIHVPILILLFGGITGVILILGLRIYRKREQS